MAEFIDEYLTISKPSEGFFKDRGSKFLAFAYPVESEEEIKQIQENLRSEYHDARHHCYAYMLGIEKENFRANDDGEPSSTAGKPILGQIRSFDLTNVLIIVVRYFGGTKLGTGGLIKAYTESAKAAVYGCQQKVIEIVSQITFRYGYDYTNLVMSMLSAYEVKVVEEVFDNDVYIKGEINRSFVSAFIDEMFDKSNGRIEVSRCS